MIGPSKQVNTQANLVSYKSGLVLVYQCGYNVYRRWFCMVKKLVRHGNSLALVLDRPILDLLKINEDTPLEIGTSDGKTLHIRPATGKDAVKKSLESVNRKFSKTLKNLAK